MLLNSMYLVRKTRGNPDDDLIKKKNFKSAHSAVSLETYCKQKRKKDFTDNGKIGMF